MATATTRSGVQFVYVPSATEDDPPNPDGSTPFTTALVIAPDRPEAIGKVVPVIQKYGVNPVQSIPGLPVVYQPQDLAGNRVPHPDTGDDVLVMRTLHAAVDLLARIDHEASCGACDNHDPLPYARKLASRRGDA